MSWLWYVLPFFLLFEDVAEDQEKGIGMCGVGNTYVYFPHRISMTNMAFDCLAAVPIPFTLSSATPSDKRKRHVIPKM